MMECNFAWNFGTALQKLDSAKNVFRNLFSFFKVAHCFLYYNPASGVKLLFNVKHLLGRKIYVAFYTYSHVNVKMAGLKPLKSFQNYFRVDVNHIW